MEGVKGDLGREINTEGLSFSGEKTDVLEQLLRQKSGGGGGGGHGETARGKGDMRQKPLIGPAPRLMR